MSDLPPEGPEVDREAWNVLAEKLGNSAFRRSFLATPQDALGQAEVGLEGLPAELIDALAELTPTELRLIGELVNRFKISPGPSICFF